MFVFERQTASEMMNDEFSRIIHKKLVICRNPSQ